jgi:uncharacterized RDD family membrane protein YckC
MSHAMTEIQPFTMSRPGATCILGAGFWRRAIAWTIDWAIVSTGVSIVFLLLALAMPGLGRVVTLSAPFDLLTTDRTIATKTLPADELGVGLVVEKIIERTVAGRWSYLYRVTRTPASSRGTWKWRQIDPATREDVRTVRLETIAVVVLFIYWILMEASRYQASLGKQALGLKVVDDRGLGLTITRAAGRNLLKVLSAMILLIGFLMAGWTRHKQTLHDLVTRCHVVLGR